MSLICLGMNFKNVTLHLQNKILTPMCQAMPSLPLWGLEAR